MENIKKLIDRCKNIDHPGQKLGEFILDHSNSPGYLVGILTMFAEAAQADLEEENRVRNAMLNSLRERKRQERIANGKEMPAPDFTWVQLHLSSNVTLPKKYGKKIKALAGDYNECRGYQNTRYVTLPWIEGGRDLANVLVNEYGKGKLVPVVIKGVNMTRLEGTSLQAWIVVHNVEKTAKNPMAQLRQKYEKAFSQAQQTSCRCPKTNY